MIKINEQSIVNTEDIFTYLYFALFIKIIKKINIFCLIKVIINIVKIWKIKFIYKRIHE